MKAKKWLTIMSLIVSLLALVAAFVIGKDSNCMFLWLFLVVPFLDS